MIHRIVSRLFAVFLIALPMSAASAVNNAGEAEPLNVVLFLVDDLGWTDVGCFGSRLHQTPNIDRLAQSGVRFTDAYAPACSCSPSRAGVMTGKYPARLGMTAIVEKHRGDVAPKDAPRLPATTKPSLPANETTIAEILKAAGYTTGLVGKWHLGDRHHDPKQHGFDVAIGAPHAGAQELFLAGLEGQSAADRQVRRRVLDRSLGGRSMRVYRSSIKTNRSS